ncbi:Nuclear receptor 2C2-associated protein [Cladochytrium tenue]|nr:Nuclear receptor 2C2-associated protein [Cladochytrium tenue]
MPLASSSLVRQAKVRVSSVLNRDQRSFGRQNLIDGDPETCWNSEQVGAVVSGSPQWISVDFGRPAVLKELRLTFQGGFVGCDCELQTPAADGSQWDVLERFYPEDSNSTQIRTVIFTDPCIL